MLKKILDRLIYDCGQCGENVFDVSDQEHIGELPFTFECAGCSSLYTAQLNEKGKFVVYRGKERKLQPKPAKEVAAVKEATPISVFEPLPEEKPKRQRKPKKKAKSS